MGEFADKLIKTDLFQLLTEDQLDAMDEEELFDSVPDAPSLPIEEAQTASDDAHAALVSPVGGGTPKPLAIDNTLTASDEYGALSLDEPPTAEQSFAKLPMIPDVATASAELNAVTENDGIGVETVLGGDLDAETIDPEADIAVADNCNHFSVASFNFLNIGCHFFMHTRLRRDTNNRHLFIDQGNRPMLHFCCRVAFRMDIRNFL